MKCYPTVFGAASPTRGDSETDKVETAFRCTRMAWPPDGQNSLFMKDVREEDSYFSRDGGVSWGFRMAPAQSGFRRTHERTGVAGFDVPGPQPL